MRAIRVELPPRCLAQTFCSRHQRRRPVNVAITPSVKGRCIARRILVAIHEVLQQLVYLAATTRRLIAVWSWVTRHASGFPSRTTGPVSGPPMRHRLQLQPTKHNTTQHNT